MDYPHGLSKILSRFFYGWVWSSQRLKLRAESDLDSLGLLKLGDKGLLKVENGQTAAGGC
jgi:hypothetical protein